jgi:hypothetical protein
MSVTPRADPTCVQWVDVAEPTEIKTLLTGHCGQTLLLEAG